MTIKPPNSGADNSFPKKLRLSGKKEISELFNDGSFFYLKPFKIYYQIKQKEIDAFPRLLISVPKSKTPKAAHRNRIKRLIKEAFRLNKGILFSTDQSVHLMIDKFALIYLGDRSESFGEIETKLKKILERLNSILRNEYESN